MVDALPCLGPLRDILHLKDLPVLAPLSGTDLPPGTAAAAAAAGSHGGGGGGPGVLLALTGSDRSGSVAVLRRGLVPEVWKSTLA